MMLGMVPLDVDRALTGERWHIPSEVLVPLCEAITAICRSKHDVLMFLRGCGVHPDLMADLVSQVNADRDSIYKREIAESVIERLNEHGDSVLRVRREIVRQVSEFEDFSRCWPNDQDRARGLVAKFRGIVGQKDAFTRMAQEREREAVERRKEHRESVEAKIEAKEKLKEILDLLRGLFNENDPYKRAKDLESLMNDLFRAVNISIRKSFTISSPLGTGTVDQIDGAIEMDGHVYLVEAKWWNKKLGPKEINDLLGSLYARSEVRGLFISASGYTSAAEDSAREALHQKVVILCTIEEIILVLESDGDITEFLKEKVRVALLDKNPNGQITL